MSRQTETRVLDDVDISATKMDRASHQIDHAIKTSGIAQMGQSRHDAKMTAREDGLHGSHDVNASIGVTSWASLHKLESQAKVFAAWSFGTHKINNINQIKPEHVAGFLTALVDRGYARNTVQGYAAGLNKLAQVLDRAQIGGTAHGERWAKAIDGCRDAVNSCVQKDTATRAYADPHAIVAAMPDARMQLVASMQLGHGLRIADATKIDASKISADGKTLTIYNSKNGQDITVTLRSGEADRIRTLADESGKIIVTQREYRAALSKACADTGQVCTGSHGLRHNYAQDRMEQLTSGGMSYDKALATVSDEMGHHRPEITQVYLR
jgi:integrase